MINHKDGEVWLRIQTLKNFIKIKKYKKINPQIESWIPALIINNNSNKF